MEIVMAIETSINPGMSSTCLEACKYLCHLAADKFTGSSLNQMQLCKYSFAPQTLYYTHSTIPTNLPHCPTASSSPPLCSLLKASLSSGPPTPSKSFALVFCP
jgi:hypothetical protein